MSKVPIGRSEAVSESLTTTLSDVSESQPLVQSLVNRVTTNDVANLILHWGALPVMADAPGEAGEMTHGAGALLFHTSPMEDSRIEAMYETAAVAEEIGVPIVLDPIGAGATPTRENVLSELLSEISFTAIKGNYGEITALAGEAAEVKGVESIGEYERIADTAQSLAAETGAVVVASGVDDIVADAASAYQISAGHEMLGEVVGTGCMLGASVASFCGGVSDPLEASVYAALAFGLAGEDAAALPYNGPASYKQNLLDSAWQIAEQHDTDRSIDDRISQIA
ncbi:hydroxyethylthiazole kinase [Halorubraceae archaeon YAN]|nr:hydroxyethylthiazole kinase [Halorubraceae archaeon YAN]